MNTPHNKFCVLPWVSLEASPIGTVRPCCLAEDELVDNVGEKFNLATASFADIQNSNGMRKLRQDFINQTQPQTCRKCWREEKSGRTSKRMHTLDRLKHMIPDQDWSDDAVPLMFLDLKLGNICNLKCRICGSWSSSTFAAEELANLPCDQDKKTSHHYQMLRQGAWPRENQNFWTEIDQVADQIKYIEFTGGEPFMITEHFDMLQGLVDRGLAARIEIHYNTNGTQWPAQAEAIWQHFRHVEVAFSVDDIEERFEYQRSNARWSEVCANIKLFRDMRSRLSNMTLQVCCTVNVFNVLYLEHIAKWIALQNFDFVYWNMMHDAYYFSIATLPQAAKFAVANSLRTADVDFATRKEFDHIQEFMMAGTSLDGFILRMRIADLDRKRGQNLSTIQPELAEIIDYVFQT